MIVNGIAVWIDAPSFPKTALSDPDDALSQAIASTIASGVCASQIRVLTDDVATAELTEAAGARVISCAAQALNQQLAEEAAEILIWLRNGALRPEAAGQIRAAFDRFGEVVALYGDSLDSSSEQLRPAFSPIRLRSNDYLGPVIAFRTRAIRDLGGFRNNANKAQPLDLVLRLHRVSADLTSSANLTSDAESNAETRIQAEVMLLPELLATENTAVEDDARDEAEMRVVTAHLTDSGIAAEVNRSGTAVRRVHYAIRDEPLVSIIIPTRGSSANIAGTDRVLVTSAVRGILERCSYHNVEFVIVADTDTPEAVVTDLVELGSDRVRIVEWASEFNFSAKMNRGAAAARGDYLLLLNDDVDPVTPDWIEAMLGLAQQEDVGVVGAQLFFEDTTLQHAGHVYLDGLAGHAAFGARGDFDDALKSLSVEREVSGVTAACALVRRSVFSEVGGLSPLLPGNYNDVDFCLKVRGTGRSAVITPFARLYHFESKTRDPQVKSTEIATLQARWSRKIQVEVYSRGL